MGFRRCDQFGASGQGGCKSKPGHSSAAVGWTRTRTAQMLMRQTPRPRCAWANHRPIHRLGHMPSHRAGRVRQTLRPRCACAGLPPARRCMPALLSRVPNLALFVLCFLFVFVLFLGCQGFSFSVFLFCLGNEWWGDLEETGWARGPWYSGPCMRGSSSH